METRAYWLGFHLVPKLGSAGANHLLDYFGDIETAWFAGRDDLSAAGMRPAAISAFEEARSTISLEREMTKIERHGAEFVTIEESSYPRLLREISNPPSVLYYRGTLCPEDETSIGIVGTRRMTSYGDQMTRMLTGGLARHGVTIVSGMAQGVDGIAHQVALDQGARTLAVMGTGIEDVYPAVHRKLAEDIIENGALVTEFPIGTPGRAANFPVRNRIISGLSLGVVVIEAPKSSGALITASYAADHGRTVYAVPGSALSASSEGTLELLRNGATLAARPDDILNDLKPAQRQLAFEMRQTLPAANEQEASVLEQLGAEPRHIDEVALGLGCTISELSALLLQMQLKGMVRDSGGQQYIRSQY